jgi:hypothetical protein
MPLRFLLDENLRGPLWHAVHRHNVAGSLPIDVARVGDPPDLPLASPDGRILAWCEQNDRILVSLDHDTLPGHLNDRLARGEHSPGIFLIRPGSSLRDSDTRFGPGVAGSSGPRARASCGYATGTISCPGHPT